MPAETLYQGLLPSLPQYMVSDLCLGPHGPLSQAPAPPVTLRPFSCLLRACAWPLQCNGTISLPQIALLKILLAAAPTSKAKTDSINILADVLPEEMP